MGRVHLLLAPLPFICAIIMAGACSQDASHVALRISTKKGLLDDVQAELRVIDAAEASCASGIVTPEDPPGDAVQSFDLKSSGCAQGAKLCAEVTLEKDGEDRVFEVVARRAGSIRARGCTTVAVDQDPLEVNITVIPNLPPACCNDGIIQAGEQCDDGIGAATDCAGNPIDPTPGTCGGVNQSAVCECDCLAKEILLSEAGSNPPLNNDVATKFDLALAFSGSTGSADVANSLRAVFTDSSTAPDANTAPNINQRVLSQTLEPIAAPPLNQQLRLKNSCNGAAIVAAAGLTLSQGQPDIAAINDEFLAVVFQDDNDTGNPVGNYNIHLIQIDGEGCGSLTNVKVNQDKSNSLERPAVAGGPSGQALVVWADGASLRGRIWMTDADASCSTCIPAMADIDIGSIIQGTTIGVAGNADGWVVVYTGQGQDRDIFIRSIDLEGSVGAETVVNLATVGAQDEADVAMLADGRFAVTWSNEGVLQFQRFDASGTSVSGDQEQPLSVSSPPGGKTAIAAGDDSGGFYAAAWQSGTDGTIWGRFLGADDRFLINAVNGTFDDFLASHPSIVGQRVNPDVAVGGAGWVAIGWTDLEPANPGVKVRRLPLPSALVQ